MIIQPVQIDTTLVSRRNTNLRATKSMRIGGGSTLFGADVRGIWLGAKTPEDAPFYVDMEGNLRGLNLLGVTITGSTITGGLFRTATSGQRIEISSISQNEIRFYDDTDLYGQLEVYSDAFTGYVSLNAENKEVEMRIETGLGVNAGYRGIALNAGSASMGASGNASVGFATSIGIIGGIQLSIDNIGGTDTFNISNLPTSAPLMAGSVWNDSGTLKIT